MKRFFILCLLVVVMFFFTSCVPEWELVEEAVLLSAEYHKGSFSASPYWKLTFEGGAIMRLGANNNQMLFIGKTYEIFHRKETSTYSESCTVRLKK